MNGRYGYNEADEKGIFTMALQTYTNYDYTIMLKHTTVFGILFF